jgi:UDP-3-O-[3-hydroxymyristoyl] glucosamine N-acyltransferase
MKISRFWNQRNPHGSSGDIVFVNHPKYYDKALNSAATIILIDKVECPEGKALLVSDDPFRDLIKSIPILPGFRISKKNFTMLKLETELLFILP